MKLKRLLCGILAAFLISYSPITSYAAATSIAVTAGSYVINLILNACGIDFSLSSITTILGEWKDYQDYMDKGASGELGLFSQYLYDRSQDNSLSEELRQDALAQIEVLNNAVSSAWGATISGVKGLISALKTWVSGLAGYGTDTKDYTANISANPPAWTLDNSISVTPYNLRTLPSYTYPAQYIKSNEYVFTSFGVSPYTNYALVRNWYKPSSVDVFGFFEADKQVVRLCTKDGNTYKSYSMFYYFDYVDKDGNYKYSTYDTKYNTMTFVAVDAKYVGTLPFTVFKTSDAAAQYCQTGIKANIYKPGEISIPADAVNVDVQKAVLKDIPDSITLPASEGLARARIEEISTAITTDETTLKTAVAAGGLAIDWGRDTTGEEETDADVNASLKDITGAIDALPRDIADELEKRTETDGETARRRLTLSASIADKFPFCIPFDIAYLIQTLAAERETPVFAIPLKIEYGSFAYNETYYIDFSFFDDVAVVLRIILDLLFCAGLISTTRNLIRG